MANRVAPAFRFCLGNSTLIQATPIRYLFLSFVTHHCNTYSKILKCGALGLDFIGNVYYNVQADNFRVERVRADVEKLRSPAERARLEIVYTP